MHETAHQWWFEQVGNDQGLEPWLDEALATYSEIVFYETVSPDALRDWWWTYRFDPYKPENKVDIRVYDGEGQRPYWNKVYLNGAHFLQDLRARVGDDIFFRFPTGLSYAGETERSPPPLISSASSVSTLQRIYLI